MRCLRNLQSPAQNVCIFCLYRSVPKIRAPAQREFHAIAPGLQRAARKQHDDPFFDASDGAGFGALGDEVERKDTPVPTISEEETSRMPRRGSDFGARSSKPTDGRDAGLGQGTGQARRNWDTPHPTQRPLVIRRIQSTSPFDEDISSPNVRAAGQKSALDELTKAFGDGAFGHMGHEVDAGKMARWAINNRPLRDARSRPGDLGLQESDGSRQPPVQKARDPAVEDNRSRWSKPEPLTRWKALELNHDRFDPVPVRYTALDPRFDPDQKRMQDRIGRSGRASPGLRNPMSTAEAEFESITFWSDEEAGKEPRISGRPSASHGEPSELPRSQQLAGQLDEYGREIAGSANTGIPGDGDVGHDSRDIYFDSSNRRRKSTRKVYEAEEEEADSKRRAGRREREEEDPYFDRDEYHRRKRERQRQRAAQEARDAVKREIKIPDFISIGQLATELNIRYARFAEVLQKFGFDETNSDYILNADDAAMIAEEAGFTPITESAEEQDLFAAPLPENMSELPQRPPVVTIMGHVDHGKTTILDYMRKSSIAASEHGGITQHIGAFSVPMPSGKVITFLDTPGHAAFLSMRQRGANVTDIVVLVVAADDSVMPQTLEALKHANAAKVPIIVALNKIDKPEAKPELVKQDLARHGVEIEDFGGDVQVVPVSGKTGQGMQDLEEAIIALSEIQDQRAPIDGNVEGWVLESSTKEVGKVATALIRRGTLQLGDIIVAGTEFCRVRMMRDEFGNQIPSAGPGMPAEVVGWRGQPKAGDELLQARDEQHAHRIISVREANAARAGLGKDVDAINVARRAQQIRHERDIAIKRARKQNLVLPQDATPADTDGGEQHGPKPVYFIVKGDVAGSVEAVVNAISAFANADVNPVILHSGVGPVSESNVDHATAAGGYVVSFNLPLPAPIRSLAERAGTSVIEDNVIYRLIDRVKEAVEEILPSVTMSKALGEAEILQVFEIQLKGRKFQKVAGCRVRNGSILKSARVRVTRGKQNEVIWSGNLSSLKNVKKNVTEMGKGTECGMSFDSWEDFQVGDVVQCFEEWEEKRRL